VRALVKQVHNLRREDPELYRYFWDQLIGEKENFQ